MQWGEEGERGEVPSSDGGVELPGDVGGAEDEDAGCVISYSVHLYEHLRFYSPAGFTLAFSSGPA